MKTAGHLGRAAEILLVEDCLDDVELTRLAFQEINAGHHLHVVHDGEQAMAFLRGEGDCANSPRPDLVLLDLNMPVKDGREVLREIKQDSTLRQIPVIILTTSDAAMDRLLAYNQHANAYLVKPLEFDDWLEMLRAISQFWLRLVHYPPAIGRA